MVAHSLPTAQGSDRKGKRAGRRPSGVKLKDRAGYWYAEGRFRLADGRSVRVRQSLGLAVANVSECDAQVELEAVVDEIKAKATGKIWRGHPVSIAAEAYLSHPRQRPLRPSTISIIKEIVARFGARRLNEIASTEWNAWIDGEHTSAGFRPGRMTGRAASSRERHLNGLIGFLNFAQRHHGLAVLPTFERDKKARNPNRRARRRVSDLRPDLIQLLFDSAHITIRAQLAVERATGARVSSVLHAARICDLVLAKGREQITFPDTKNGADVHAVLDRTAVTVLKEYLKWRGKLHDREAPLFLTHRHQPYVDNGRSWGSQNKTGFNAAKRRAAATLSRMAEVEAVRLRKRGRSKAAQAVLERAQADAKLIKQVTQHWFRHLLATKLLRRDPRAAMEQGGWLDIRSVMGYSHDVPEYRRKLVHEVDDLDPNWTHSRAKKQKKRPSLRAI
jgi:site-specific recombinase XerD